LKPLFLQNTFRGKLPAWYTVEFDGKDDFLSCFVAMLSQVNGFVATLSEFMPIVVVTFLASEINNIFTDTEEQSKLCQLINSFFGSSSNNIANNISNSDRTELTKSCLELIHFIHNSRPQTVALHIFKFRFLVSLFPVMKVFHIGGVFNVLQFLVDLWETFKFWYSQNNSNIEFGRSVDDLSDSFLAFFQLSVPCLTESGSQFFPSFLHDVSQFSLL
jgi:hypothetical protein